MAGEGSAGVSVADGAVESLLAAGGGTGVAGVAAVGGAGTGAGAWKAGGMPAPISLRRKFAASASFLSHAKYACGER